MYRDNGKVPLQGSERSAPNEHNGVVVVSIVFVVVVVVISVLVAIIVVSRKKKRERCVEIVCHYY
jgi:heme/copper-type cytochrome/quinol oxidase subunit 2